MTVVVRSDPKAMSLSQDPLELLPRKRPQAFDRDDVVYRPDDPSDSLFLVVDGAIKISRIAENGRETVIDFAARENFFGLSSLLESGKRGELATALERSAVMEWPIEELRSLLARTPELGPALLRILAQKLNDSETRIESFATDHIPRRLVKTLLRLGERFGEPLASTPKLRLMPLTHELLAKHVGTSREIITQHMGALRKRGLVEYSRSGLEFDPSALRREIARSN